MQESISEGEKPSWEYTSVRIPAELHAQAKKAGLKFSRVLIRALKAELKYGVIADPSKINHQIAILQAQLHNSSRIKNEYANLKTRWNMRGGHRNSREHNIAWIEGIFVDYPVLNARYTREELIDILTGVKQL